MRIAFRADSSTEIGTGHIVRCLNLADALGKHGASSVFVCRDLPGHVADQIRERGYEVILLPLPREVAGSNGDAQATALALGDPVDWLVVDSYALDAHWESALRSHATRILVIDDLADREHDCDVLLDQNHFPEADARYRPLVPASCRLLLGPRYALLSPAPAAMPPVGPRAGAVRRILVFFGGSDPRNETGKALDALRAIDATGLTVDVVAGAANPHKDHLRAAVEAIPNARLHVQVSDMHERVSMADLALGAGGTSAWERCRAGLPCITVAIAENQMAPSAALAEYGACLYLGPSRDVTSERIEESVRFCLGSPWLVKHLSTRALGLVDGMGAERVAAAITADSVLLRPAAQSDSDRVFEWRNHLSVRRQSLDPRELSLDDHRRWFTSALQDPSRLLLVAEVDGESVGVLRYDLAGMEARVSIYLAPGRGGRGLGTAILRLGSRWMAREHPHVVTSVAEILSHNRASRGAFAAAGYRERSVTLVLTPGSTASGQGEGFNHE